MTRLRWRLARLVAPAPLLIDPFPGEDGVMVVYRENGVQWAIRAERFRLKSTLNLARLDYEPGRPFHFQRSRSFTRFVGTVRP